MHMEGNQGPEPEATTWGHRQLVAEPGRGQRTFHPVSETGDEGSEFFRLLRGGVRESDRKHAAMSPAASWWSLSPCAGLGITEPAGAKHWGPGELGAPPGRTQGGHVANRPAQGLGPHGAPGASQNHTHRLWVKEATCERVLGTKIKELLFGRWFNCQLKEENKGLSSETGCRHSKRVKKGQGPRLVQQTQCFLNRQQGQDPSEDQRPSEAVKWKAGVAGIPSKYLLPSLLLELLS